MVEHLNENCDGNIEIAVVEAMHGDGWAKRPHRLR